MTTGNKIILFLFFIISLSIGLLNITIVFLSDYNNISIYVFVAAVSFFLCSHINDELLSHEESNEYE